MPSNLYLLTAIGTCFSLLVSGCADVHITESTLPRVSPRELNEFGCTNSENAEVKVFSVVDSNQSVKELHISASEWLQSRVEKDITQIDCLKELGVSSFLDWNPSDKAAAERGDADEYYFKPLDAVLIKQQSSVDHPIINILTYKHHEFSEPMGLFVGTLVSYLTFNIIPMRYPMDVEFLTAKTYPNDPKVHYGRLIKNSVTAVAWLPFFFDPKSVTPSKTDSAPWFDRAIYSAIGDAMDVPPDELRSTP